MKRTRLYDVHRELGAKLVEFGGFEMPVQYSSIIEEHRRVRSSVGVFDVSHMGEFKIQGKNAASLLQKMTINDVSKLSAGKAQYSAMCYEDGGIVDDLLVYHLGDSYMMVVNASNTEKDFQWLQEHLSDGVELIDVSDDISLLAVQGPKSLVTLQKLTDVELSRIKYYSFSLGTLAGVPMVISRTGYTGEVGFEIYVRGDSSTVRTVWQEVVDAGREFGIGPAGLGARDTLRLEMGYCLYGNDIDKMTNPLEAGLGWITKLEKGDFVGRAALLKVKQEGLRRKLAGFTLDASDGGAKMLPRHGCEIVLNGKGIGHVTSGTFSPSLEKGIGLGYVAVDHSQPGSSIGIRIRNRDVHANVVPLPFLRK
ncbi:MAG: glycine cleavage system aminomethyltransferase GcvT [Bacteroidota bacterium]